MLPFVNSRWRVNTGYFLLLSRFTLHPSPSCYTPGGCPLWSAVQPSGFQWVHPAGNRAEVGGKEERGSGYLFPQFPPPVRKCRLLSGSPLLSGSGKGSPPCPFKMLRFPEPLEYSTISCDFFPPTPAHSFVIYFLSEPFLIQGFKVFATSLQFLYF